MHQEYSKARRSKDKTYDGRFFFGVKTTGIFCRPSCPSPVAHEKNVAYFHTIFEALEQGFRPCYRCRPDVEVAYTNGNIRGTFLVKEALEKIYGGYLHDHSLQELAATVGVSDRHLRQLFVDNLGAPPVTIARYHKALFAKKLLLYSDQSITDIAYASGFGSIRQFNEVFKKVFGNTPTRVRQEAAPAPQSGTGNPGHNTLLRLPCSSPVGFSRILDFLRPRAVSGVEVVTKNSYSRTFRTATARGYFTVTHAPKASALELRIGCDDIRCFMEIHNRVRTMFDLDTDFSRINPALRRDPELARGMADGHVPRLPVAFSPFEFAVRAILGQQVTVKAATTLAGRIAERAALKTDGTFPEGLTRFFPDPDELLALDLDAMGLTRTRRATVHTAAQAIRDGRVKLTVNQPFETFHRDFSSLKGIGDWTVHYVAMRGLGMKDCFPASDLGVIKALTQGKKPTPKEALARADAWRPYRSYATLCLWSRPPEPKKEATP
ncbi:DNA-3-methyladenine glycosylase 2 family protein [Desulfoluna spongiiphila]|uniref:DNA-3-methyladenine glycosylase 2 family protein n=1 Tax=Desulfoluna spongiiphila TaxID=419481 RepID=UPI001254B650|nr:AlkA N-terminal domain-containing protein [Desulfoluna spongiiphila]VVS92396.1 transcription regulator hth arac- type [Desulfoluna spongiiphila]